MTKDDVIRMMEESGLVHGAGMIRISKFANLVAAFEREECAKLCEMVKDDDIYFGSQYAAAIRERGAP